MGFGLSNWQGGCTLKRHEEDCKKSRLGVEIRSLCFDIISLADLLDSQVGWSCMLRKCKYVDRL